MMEIITKIFFLTHIPITLFVDLSPLYPTGGVFSFTHWIRNQYIARFNDPLVAGLSRPGGWFSSLLFLEGAIQLPICLYIALQYYRGQQSDSVTRYVIVLYSTQVMTATWACIFECLAFDSSIVTNSQKACLIGFYAPYLVVPLLMAGSNSRALFNAHRQKSCELRYLRNKCDQANVKQVTKITENIMITGANSGVGFGIVQQLISQHSIALERGDLQLNLFLTVRDQVKAGSVTSRLETDLQKYGKNIKIEFIYMDLLSMSSVEAASQRVVELLGQDSLSSLICNAGMAQFVRIDLKKATMQALFHPIQAISEPNYKIQKVGGKSKDGLGATFQANLFGHFYLSHRLQELGKLNQNSNLIWMSSLEATKSVLEDGDLQALTHESGYESSKRVMDILWRATPSTTDGPRVFCVHPGLCTTNIVADMVPNWLAPAWTWTFHIVRTMGLKFHVATAFNGAYAPAVLAMESQEYVDRAGTVKYGSAMTWDGTPYVADTAYDVIDEEQSKDVLSELQALYAHWREILVK